MSSKKNISIIGATGNLGVPVVLNLSNMGFEIKVISRNSEKANKLFKHLNNVEVVEADLRNKADLKMALSGTSYLYLNLSTNSMDVNSPFLPEREGVANIIESVDRNSLKQIISISGLGAMDNVYAKSSFKFIPNIVRKQGHRLIKDSNIPYTILHCTWFADSFVLYRRKNIYSVIGNNTRPIYFTNCYDYSRHLANAIGNSEAYCKEFPIQGANAYIHSKAAEEFFNIYNNKTKVRLLPLKFIKFLSFFGKDLKFLKHMADYFNQFDEELITGDYNTYETLGHPKYNIKEYALMLNKNKCYSYLA
ncbi:MAG: hypothetical protein C0598_05830 [Marinilabiliales bacterium]|nr:MAG: hypothetical protein C0598_05830 [Marinilabiliales bacterium]